MTQINDPIERFDAEAVTSIVPHTGYFEVEIDHLGNGGIQLKLAPNEYFTLTCPGSQHREVRQRMLESGLLEPPAEGGWIAYSLFRHKVLVHPTEGVTPEQIRRKFIETLVTLIDAGRVQTSEWGYPFTY